MAQGPRRRARRVLEFAAGAALGVVISAQGQERGADDPSAEAGAPIDEARTLAAEEEQVVARIIQATDSGQPQVTPLLNVFQPARLWRERLAEARLARARSTAERADAIRPYVEWLESKERLVEPGLEAHHATRFDQDVVRYELLKARRWLLREQGL